MGTAFCIIDIVTKTEYIFVKFINVLEGRFYLNTFCLALKINNIADSFFVFI